MEKNMFAKAEEYQALRKYIKLTEGGSGTAVSAARKAIETELTPRQRQLIYMYYLEQKRMQDIADELGLHISSVSRTIKRGKKRLERCIRYGGRTLLNAVED